MIWVHCGDASEITTTLSLANRLIEHSDAADVLVTCDAPHLSAFETLPSDVICVEVPSDSPTKCRAFLDKWGPSYLIWNGGALRPALLRQVERSGIAATLINARNAGLIPGGSRWLPRATRSAVSPFHRILTADGATATRLMRGGVAAEQVEATGPILEEPIPLPHDQYELTVMAEAFGARPMWLAADVVQSEVVHMAAAHMAASRKSHRLIMVLSPRDIGDGPKSAQVLRDAGFRVGVRSEGDDPEPEHQVYVADLPDELGLWYRLVPLTFMGGTMSGGGASSPFEPILLGSAVVHGTRKSPHQTRFERLASVQACREIRSASELGIAISVLISPEQTARMALAGWDEITHNAETINRLIETAMHGVARPEGAP
ncbi:3-deoxy-manno-octulosonate cytidylyltransferase [Octadecabacter sp. G9-8]|uniref:3-deoxy-D-manno-octulosonic acid transferase n=1 Tax=Octadecabacter dasysiphoniae TaxID=2909341 RepID=A0ABS9CYV7_9RHOB|nr:3-deoxy-manno-octulosonate cytidylyltransferase [Octadecabacter dasysiphoniae]